MATDKNNSKGSLCEGDEVAGRTLVPASIASLRYVKRMLSFDHFLMISPNAFLHCLVHTLYTPKQRHTCTPTHTHNHTDTHTHPHAGHNIGRNSPALNDIIA